MKNKKERVILSDQFLRLE
jgi:hypothetical protein